MVIRALVAMAVAALLSGCVHATQTKVTFRCSKIVELSKDQQTKAANELDKLPAGSVIGDVLMPELGRLRAESRACLGK